GHVPLGPGELEGVPKKVRNDGSEDLMVGLDGHVAVRAADRETEAARPGFHRGGDLDFFDELGHGDALTIPDAGLEANAGQRAVDEVTQPGEAPAEQRAAHLAT